MQKVPMTVAGAEKLRAELSELKTVKRPKISAAIADAREHGDLKENAEYHAAREQQSFCEGRIKEIEGKLADSEVIDVTKIEPPGALSLAPPSHSTTSILKSRSSIRLSVKTKPMCRLERFPWPHRLPAP